MLCIVPTVELKCSEQGENETNGLFWVRDAILGASQVLTHSGAGSDPPRLLYYRLHFADAARVVC